ncbi:hypothetical protein NM688_g5573 [Phlebia brevispora]|uniref:Uncharacterized protein n=1 Tax=Phlebia brevispora TaxID=194682 RepID=A0ACC1SSZ0_9APHY|nr:hypothetical protein NM688_g5573 [Phlebia brevispora]
MEADIPTQFSSVEANTSMRFTSSRLAFSRSGGAAWDLHAHAVIVSVFNDHYLTVVDTYGRELHKEKIHPGWKYSCDESPCYVIKWGPGLHPISTWMQLRFPHDNCGEFWRFVGRLYASSIASLLHLQSFCVVSLSSSHLSPKLPLFIRVPQGYQYRFIFHMTQSVLLNPITVTSIEFEPGLRRNRHALPTHKRHLRPLEQTIPSTKDVRDRRGRQASSLLAGSLFAPTLLRRWPPSRVLRRRFDLPEEIGGFKSAGSTHPSACIRSARRHIAIHVQLQRKWTLARSGYSRPKYVGQFDFDGFDDWHHGSATSFWVSHPPLRTYLVQTVRREVVLERWWIDIYTSDRGRSTDKLECPTVTNEPWTPTAVGHLVVAMKYHQTFELGGFACSVNCLDFSCVADFLAIGDDKGVVTIVDYIRKVIILQLGRPQAVAVTAIKWHKRDSNVLFCGYGDGGIVIFDMTVDSENAWTLNQAPDVLLLQVDYPSSSAIYQNHVDIWQSAERLTLPPSSTDAEHDASPRSLQFLENGTYLAVTYEAGGIFCLHIQRRAIVWSIHPRSNVGRARVSADRTLVVVSNLYNGVDCYDTKTGLLIHTYELSLPQNLAIPVEFIHGSHDVACGSTCGLVTIWDAKGSVLRDSLYHESGELILSLACVERRGKHYIACGPSEAGDATKIKVWAVNEPYPPIPVAKSDPVSHKPESFLRNNCIAILILFLALAITASAAVFASHRGDEIFR